MRLLIHGSILKVDLTLYLEWDFQKNRTLNLDVRTFVLVKCSRVLRDVKKSTIEKK